MGRVRRMGDDEGGQLVAGQSGERPRAQSQLTMQGSVLRLRRIQPNHEDEGTTDTEKRAYSHRWIVSGHFRNQAFGQNWSEHRVIWIPPYVAGPAGKPLVIKEKVTVIR